MNTTAPYQNTVLGDIKSGRIVWSSLSHAEKSALIDRAIMNREHTGIDAMNSVTLLKSIIDSDRLPGTYLYMFAARSVELRGLEQVGREIAEAKDSLRLATCFIEAFGIEKAPLLGSDLANKVKGSCLEDQLGL
jgi:hypothetical protein